MDAWVDYQWQRPKSWPASIGPSWPAWDRVESGAQARGTGGAAAPGPGANGPGGCW
jgi:hypothetical protein